MLLWFATFNYGCPAGGVADLDAFSRDFGGLPAGGMGHVKVLGGKEIEDVQRRAVGIWERDKEIGKEISD